MIYGDGGIGEIREECKSVSGLTASCGQGWSEVDGRISTTGSMGLVAMASVECVMCGGICGAVGCSISRGTNVEVCSATMVLVKSGFLCGGSLYPTNCSYGMDDCGGLILSSMVPLVCRVSIDRTGLFIIIFLKSGRRYGN